MTILNDLFTGWREGVLGRLKFVAYMFLISAALVFSTVYFLVRIEYSLTLIFYCLMIILYNYCGLLILVKRYRELISFPFIIALIHWGSISVATWMGWGLMASIGWLIIVLISILPASRSRT